MQNLKVHKKTWYTILTYLTGHEQLDNFVFWIIFGPISHNMRKNEKMAILKFAVICFFTQDCYKVISFQ
jgi:hypothetical protein